MAIIKIKNPAIDLDAAEIPNIDASKITTGSLGADRIPGLAASKITSGTFSDARIAASNVSQHATSFDDNKLVNDISTLAIRQASNENKAAYNTNSMYVDVFQDATGITNLTNSFRNANEYINTVSETLGTSISNITNSTSPQTGNGTSAAYATFPDFLFNSNNGNNGMWYIGQYNSSYILGETNSFVIDLNNNYLLNGCTISWTSWNTAGRINNHRWLYKDISGNWQYLNGTGSNSASGTSSSSSELSGSNSDTQHTITVNTDATYAAQEIALQPRTYYDNGNANAGISQIIINAKSYSLSANATGSVESNAITASSSTSKMGAIITYQDNAGTNTLNTDIVLQLSADNGSNFATATMTAMPDFASGIKMAKVNDLSVTAGTQLKYKISFANQAAGSKEARIRGVSLQY